MTPGPPSVPDDEWERFVREAKKSMPAPSLQVRKARKAAKASSPDSRKRRRRLRRLLVLGAVALVAAFAVQAYRSPGETRDQAAASPVETRRPSAPPPTEVFPDRPTRERPFAGSPAAKWADGEKGIGLPDAKAVGDLSRDQVASALARVKSFLLAANLDREVLHGGKPDKALDLLDPKQTDVLAELRGSLERPSFEHEPLLVFSRFDQKEVTLVGDTVKVRGQMTVKPEASGEARIHADYTFTYPVANVDRKGNGEEEVTRTVVRRVLDFVVNDPMKAQVTPGKLWLSQWSADISNSSCEETDGLLHPLFDSDLLDEPLPTGPTSDPYDRSKALHDQGAKGDPGDRNEQREAVCGAVSRI